MGYVEMIDRAANMAEVEPYVVTTAFAFINTLLMMVGYHYFRKVVKWSRTPWQMSPLGDKINKMLDDASKWKLAADWITTGLGDKKVDIFCVYYGNTKCDVGGRHASIPSWELCRLRTKAYYIHKALTQESARKVADSLGA
jgi:hypothetical protein